jgi:hypothetical protein
MTESGSIAGEMRATARHRTAIGSSQSMLARSPSAQKKCRYRRRLRAGACVLHPEVIEHAFAEALLLSGRLTDSQALRREQLTHAAENILAEFTERWLRLRRKT